MHTLPPAHAARARHDAGARDNAAIESRMETSMAKTIAAIAAAGGLAIAMCAGNAAAHDEPVKGSLIGAGIGAAIAGPPGAAVGAVIGAGIGSTIAHETDHGRRAHRGERHYSRAYIERPNAAAPVRYVAVSENARYVPAARHAANGNGSSAHCEPHKPLRKVVEKPRVKKVCRYVAVR
jgi:hypothetical protein